MKMAVDLAFITNNSFAAVPINMGRKPKKNQWTDDSIADLLQCHRIAHLQKEGGNTKGLYQIVYEEWSKDHAHHKTTKAALKIKLITMKQQGLITDKVKFTEPKDPPQDINMNVLNQSVAAIEINDAIETQQSTPGINPTMEKEPTKQDTNHAVEQPLPPVSVAINDNDATTTNTSKKAMRKLKKSKRKFWTKRMMFDLTACHKIARKKSYGKTKSRANEILKETRKLWLQRYPSKAVSLTSIRFELNKNKRRSSS